MSEKKWQRGWAVLFLAVPVFFVFCAGFPLWFDLNDDVLMNQILNGIYTGTPELRNIQSLFPLSAVLGGLGRLIRFPWYPALLMLLLFVSFFRITRLAFRKTEGESTALRAVYVLACAFLFAGLFGYHLVFVQYSLVVGAVCSAIAAGFFGLSGEKLLRDGLLSPKALLAAVLPEIALLALSYLLRSEMTLFMAPLMGLAAFYALVREAGGTKPAAFVVRGLVVLGAALALVIGSCETADRLGYAGESWGEFRAFFDARTDLYDFQKRIAYTEETKDFFDSVPLAEEEAVLLENYNFGLDERIDSRVMGEVAAYSKSLTASKEGTAVRIRNALWDLRHSWISGLYGFAPFVLLLFVLVGCAGRKGGWLRALFGLAATGAEQTLLLYLFYHRRPVERLTHSLCLETCVFLFFLMLDAAAKERQAAGERRRHIVRMLPALVLVLGIAACIRQVSWIAAEEERRIAVNEPYRALCAYTDEQAQADPGQLYLLDVYSSVDFSEALFHNEKVMDTGRGSNLLLLGGWASKSPLEKKVLENYGYAGMEEALLHGALFVAKTGWDTEWLADYMRFVGEACDVIPVDEVGPWFTVYRLERLATQ